MSAQSLPSSAGRLPAGVPVGASIDFRSLLDARKNERRPLSLAEAVAVLVPLTRVVAARHSAGEHFYVYPARVLCTADGSATLAEGPGSAPTDPADRACLAPELETGGKPDARASVYALGAMVYEAVTLASVGPGMKRPTEAAPGVHPGVEALVGAALVANPTGRPADLGALADALAALVSGNSAVRRAAHETLSIPVQMDDDIDIAISMAPGAAGGAMPSIPKAAPLPQVGATSAAVAPKRQDATSALSDLKARLEADPRPRYVVSKNFMDHGPFSAVELLQQIGSGLFVLSDSIRDEVAGQTRLISEWPDFAPFAEHAQIHRQVAEEKKAVVALEKKEVNASRTKSFVGVGVAIALLGVGVFFVVQARGTKKQGTDISADQAALDLSGAGGGLKGQDKPKGGGGGGGAGAAGANFPGGLSYEAALNVPEDLSATADAKELSNGQLNGPMSNAAFVSSCGAPNDMKVTVRVAVRGGRAMGVTVTTNPPNGAVASCIDRHVRGLTWAVSAKRNTFTTQY